jgi:hypothetical protein
MDLSMAIQTPKDLDSSLKKTRTLHAVLVFTIPLFVYAGEVIGPVKTKYVKEIGMVLVALAVFDIWSLLSWRRRRLQKAREALRSRPDDTKAIIHWRAVNAASLTACEALAFYGCVLRVLGSTFLQAAPFYASALLLLLAFTPQRPPDHVSAHPAP